MNSPSNSPSCRQKSRQVPQSAPDFVPNEGNLWMHPQQAPSQGNMPLPAFKSTTSHAHDKKERFWSEDDAMARGCLPALPTWGVGFLSFFSGAARGSTVRLFMKFQPETRNPRQFPLLFPPFSVVPSPSTGCAPDAAAVPLPTSLRRATPAPKLAEPMTPVRSTRAPPTTPAGKVVASPAPGRRSSGAEV